MHAHNTDIVKQLFQFYAKKDIAGFMSLLSPEVVWVEPGDPNEIPYSGTFTGMAGIGAMMQKVAQSSKMTAFEATEFCANAHTVTAIGYNEAIAIVTNKPYRTDWVYAFKLSDGKVTHVQVYMDTLAMANAFKP